MAQIIYENDEAVFTFEYQDIYKKLSQTIVKNKLHDILMLFKWLQDNSIRGEQDIKIDGKGIFQQAVYLGRIVYIIRDLFADQKGTIYCKRCNQTIPISKIQGINSSRGKLKINENLRLPNYRKKIPLDFNQLI